MVAAASPAFRKLAWIVLAMLACVALIGFGQGLFRVLNAAPARSADDPALVGAAPAARAREASAAPLMDEARVREIAREEAELALQRARPKKPRAPRPAADSEDVAPSNPNGAPLPAPLATPPAQPADPPFNPEAR